VIRYSVGSSATEPPLLKEQALRSSLTTPYNKAHHYYALFTAYATFVVIVAGALVTSNEAGLAVPDWPTSFHTFRMPRMVGGVLYEHGHRMLAGITILLTLGITIYTLAVDRRGWMKKLAIGAFFTIIIQAILGGVTVLNFLPPAVSTAHAVVGQTFFCIAVAIALLTGRKYSGEVEKTAIDRRKPSLVGLTLLSVLVLYVQLALGGMFRHKGMSWEPHVFNAIVVAIVLTWTSVRVLSYYSQLEALRKPAVTMLGLLMVQLCLGFVSFLTKVIWGTDAVQPMPMMVWSTVAHVAVGALLLATAVILAIQAWRHVPVLSDERVHSTKAVTA
jgi:cytochrome c oxidase assembly protein subunit 15